MLKFEIWINYFRILKSEIKNDTFACIKFWMYTCLISKAKKFQALIARSIIFFFLALSSHFIQYRIDIWTKIQILITYSIHHYQFLLFLLSKKNYNKYSPFIAIEENFFSCEKVLKAFLSQGCQCQRC